MNRKNPTRNDHRSLFDHAETDDDVVRTSDGEDVSVTMKRQNASIVDKHSNLSWNEF